MANGMTQRRLFSVGIWVVLAAAAAPSIAKNPPPPAAPETGDLQQAVAKSAAQQDEVRRLKAMRGDRDQGDDNASPRAKEVVCSKSNPASVRSAICDSASPN